MKELLLYGLAALGGLVVLGYSVHMLIGGLVSQATEYTAIAVVCAAGAAVLGWMAWDVIQRRRGQR
ncbi:MAG: hypothetical protein M1392_03555 [Gammaproteobacteria bacterium]|nr:hypothetical protein [Gammaproteobacteria bacterium]